MGLNCDTGDYSIIQLTSHDSEPAPLYKCHSALDSSLSSVSINSSASVFGTVGAAGFLVGR